MSNFDRDILFKVTPEQYDDIKDIVETKSDIYRSVNHFIRCACIKLIREEGKRKPVRW